MEVSVALVTPPRRGMGAAPSPTSPSGQAGQTWSLAGSALGGEEASHKIRSFRQGIGFTVGEASGAKNEKLPQPGKTPWKSQSF